jgi:hypothetical protein
MRPVRKVFVLWSIVATACLCIASSGAGAAGLEGSTRMLCVLTSAVGCDSRSGCQGTPVEDLNMPQFFKIDIEKKTMAPVGVAQEVAAAWETRIKNFERMDGKIFLQGIEVRGWSIVISEETGKLTLTASGDDEAFVLFGVCIPQ